MPNIGRNIILKDEEVQHYYTSNLFCHQPFQKQMKYKLLTVSINNVPQMYPLICSIPTALHLLYVFILSEKCRVLGIFKFYAERRQINRIKSTREKDCVICLLKPWLKPSFPMVRSSTRTCILTASICFLCVLNR